MHDRNCWPWRDFPNETLPRDLPQSIYENPKLKRVSAALMVSHCTLREDGNDGLETGFLTVKSRAICWCAEMAPTLVDGRSPS